MTTFDARTGRLVVTFDDERVAVFGGIPPATERALSTSSDPLGYLNRFVAGRYRNALVVPGSDAGSHL
jgi:hypothetical protein